MDLRRNFQMFVILILIAIGFGFVGCESDGQSKDKPAIESEAMAATNDCDTITICSFNIQFLGLFKKRDNAALANLLKDYDLVVVQELVAPPVDGIYPDSEEYTADPEAEAFFQSMSDNGYEYVMSEEDTGPGDEIHKASSATEWWVTFFKPDKVEVADYLPSGFLSDDRSHNDDFERVPYAFAFTTPDSTIDFVLISVHLKPGGSRSEKERRKHELSAITEWINSNNDEEKDFIILGDMNIEDAEELADVTPAGFISLNDECRPTNTLVKDDSIKGKPYDQVMFDTTFTTEIDKNYDLEVIDLVDAMRDSWASSDPYPGEPYDHNLFKQYYSDHSPVVFKMICPERDDD